jgi:hypothetical protein
MSTNNELSGLALRQKACEAERSAVPHQAAA